MKPALHLYMSEDEILMMYRQAKNQYEQVSILAQLNACSRRQMEDWFFDHGITIKEPTKEEKYNVSFMGGENRRRRSAEECDIEYGPYYKQGWSDGDIARQVGVHPNAIKAWRKVRQLPPNRSVGRGKKTTMKQVS